MKLYELVYIMRRDLQSVEIDKINDAIVSIIGSSNIVKKESWGLLRLAYPVKKNNRGHYVYIGFRCDQPNAKANESILKTLDQKIKLNENIIRHMVMCVDKIGSAQSPMMKLAAVENEANTIKKSHQSYHQSVTTTTHVKVQNVAEIIIKPEVPHVAIVQ